MIRHVACSVGTTQLKFKKAIDQLYARGEGGKQGYFCQVIDKDGHYRPFSLIRKEMTRSSKLDSEGNDYLFGAQVPATRPATDYTARVIPYRADSAVPLEATHILWQR
jgi:hypothetical protein